MLFPSQRTVDTGHVACLGHDRCLVHAALHLVLCRPAGTGVSVHNASGMADPCNVTSLCRPNRQRWICFFIIELSSICVVPPPPHPLTLLHVQADKQLETDTGEGTAGQKAHVLHALQSQMHSVTVRSAMRLGET